MGNALVATICRLLCYHCVSIVHCNHSKHDDHGANNTRKGLPRAVLNPKKFEREPQSASLIQLDCFRSKIILDHPIRVKCIPSGHLAISYVGFGASIIINMVNHDEL